MGTDESELESDLVDLAGVTLEEISLLPDSVLAVSLRRILTHDGDDAERYVSFQECI